MIIKEVFVLHNGKVKEKNRHSYGNSRKPFSIFNETDPPTPGSLDMSQRVKETLSAVLKAAPFKRWEIAGRMREYLGFEITESQLNAWSAESKEGHRFPLEYLPAFCYATSDYTLADLIVRGCGCKLIKSEEVILLELARIDDEARQREDRKEKLLTCLEQMRVIKNKSGI